MRETLKDVLLMGLGALSLTGEKAIELKKELLEKGTHVYEEGSIKNEELKRDIKEKIKDKTNIRVTRASKEDIVEFLKGMDDDEIEELLKSVKNQKEDDESYKVEDISFNEQENEN